MLYFLLVCPSKTLFRFKCYVAIKIDAFDHIDDILVVHQQKPSPERSQHARFSLKFATWRPKIRLTSRTLSSPVISMNKYQLDRNQTRSNTTDV